MTEPCDQGLGLGHLRSGPAGPDRRLANDYNRIAVGRDSDHTNSGFRKPAAEFIGITLEILLVGVTESGVEPLRDTNGLLAGGENDVLDQLPTVGG
jgi:hypothetical protein